MSFDLYLHFMLSIYQWCNDKCNNIVCNIGAHPHELPNEIFENEAFIWIVYDMKQQHLAPCQKYLEISLKFK